MSLAWSLRSLDYCHICVKSVSREDWESRSVKELSLCPLKKKKCNIVKCFHRRSVRLQSDLVLIEGKKGDHGQFTASQHDSCPNLLTALHPLWCYRISSWLVTYHMFFFFFFFFRNLVAASVLALTDFIRVTLTGFLGAPCCFVIQGACKNNRMYLRLRPGPVYFFSNEML